jgi:hypothetical protein
MAIVDTDIFGKPEGTTSSGIRDTDIFSAPAKAEAAPAEPQKPTLTETQALIQRAKSMGWGTGFPRVMDQLGSKVGEATGSPAFGSALGTTLGFLPDAIQMATGGEIAKTAGAPMLDAAGKFLMSSALKPGAGAVRKNMAEPAVKTLLDEGINVTAGGLEKMKGTIGDLADQVRNYIGNSGAMIDLHRVADYANDAYRQFRAGPLAEQAISDIGKTQQGLFAIPEVAGAREVPVQLAQDLKRGYQKAVSDKGYGELKAPTTEAEKGIARGFRTEIGQAVPGVVDPLAREAALINALKLAERRVAVDANKNPIGLGALISQPWALPVWMWDRSPLAKSLTARMLYSGQETLPTLAGQGLAGAALYRPDGQ